MKWLGKSLLLASVCVAAASGVCLRASRASAGEALVDAPWSQSLAVSADDPADSPSTRKSHAAASPPPLREQAGVPFQPELPPDAANEPPGIPIPSSQPSPAPGPALDRPFEGARPLAKLNDKTEQGPVAPRSADVATPAVTAAAQPGGAPSSSASAWDVEAAIEAMLGEKVAGRPIGARDWRGPRAAIGVFYLTRGFSPLWTSDGGFTLAARAAIARLDRAREDGLDLSALCIPVADRNILTPAQLAQADVALSEAIVAYAIQASGGRIEPSSISPQITAKPQVADPFTALALVAAAGDPDVVLENFNPPQKAYRDLRDKLAELRADRAPAATTFPPGPTLKIGMIDPRVAIIRTRFGLDAIADGQPSSALVYDAQIAAAVADFQRANGLTPTGLLSSSTVEALSGGASSRQEAAILASMEMWRWEPRDMGEERVEVNVPDFMLKVTQGDEVIHRARVIVGKPDTQTAIFSNQIKYLLVNPAWNVPMSIIKKEMLPKLVNDPDYLTRAGFEVTQKGDMLVVRQPPGERNALGHILFMFPNEHSIYLHDTPARGLFAAPRRAFSHGCVRVDDPMRLGELAMGGAERGWTQARLHSLVGDKERTIFLPRPLAIHIEYFTAFVDDSGALQIREDIYGHTRRVEMALGLASQG